ncbi:hypothetical protein LOAG_08099, partial [Loa loa]
EKLLKTELYQKIVKITVLLFTASYTRIWYFEPPKVFAPENYRDRMKCIEIAKPDHMPDRIHHISDIQYFEN